MLPIKTLTFFAALACCTTTLFAQQKCSSAPEPNPSPSPSPSSTGAGSTPAYPPEVLAMMDLQADPCQDFYQYACGSWIKNFTLPADRGDFTKSFTSVEKDNQPVLLDILKQGKPILGELFTSCMNVDQLDTVGIAPIQATLTKIQSVTSVSELFTLAGQISQTTRVSPPTDVHPRSFSFLSTFNVMGDAKEATKNRFYCMQSDPTLLFKRNYVNAKAFAALEPVYTKYIGQMLTLTGTDPAQIDDSVKTIVDLEKQIAAVLEEDLDDPEATYNPLSFEQASTKYPHVFGEIAKGYGLLDNSALKTSDTIVLVTPSYYEQLESWVKSVPLESLKLLLKFQYTSFASAYLSEPFLAARFELFDKALGGLKERKPRDKVCTEIVRSSFPYLTGKYYVEQKFDDESRQTAKSMIAMIVDAMSNRIKNASWLDEPTRQQAEKKLGMVEKMIGYSEVVENFTLPLDPAKYFANMQAVSKYNYDKAMGKIALPVDRSEWGMGASEVNAYYDPTTNEIVFPAAILQPPFFKKNYLPAQNFGAIGLVMGHELTHGFDSSGRLYDGFGNLAPWWSNATDQEFQKRAKCLADQYSKFEVRSMNDPSVVLGNVNGNHTLGENIADNGGLGLSLDAMHAYLKQQGGAFAQCGGKDTAIANEMSTKPTPPGPSPAPTPSMTCQDMDRLYFLSFAQTWCGKYSDEYLKARLLNEHSPSKFRVVGVVQNSKDFAQVFQCPAGATMNPTDKCQVW